MLADKPNDYTWLREKLYVTTAKTSTKQKVSNVYESLSYNEDAYDKCTLMLKEKFISRYDMYNVLVNMSVYRDNISYVIKTLKELQSYSYVPYSEENGTTNTEYFEKVITKEYSKEIEADKLDDKAYLTDIIYVDTYNMMGLAIKYAQAYVQNNEIEDPSEIEKFTKDFLDKISSKQKTEKYCKILDKLHLTEYIKTLNRNEIKQYLFYENELFDNLYIRIKCIINEIHPTKLNHLRVVDKFVRLSDILEMVGEFNIEKFLQSVSESSDNTKTFNINLDGYRIKDNEIAYVSSNMNVDLYMKKEFYRLDDQLYEIYNNGGDESKNFLYMYKHYDNIDDYYDPLIQYTYIEDGNGSGKYYNEFGVEVDDSNIVELDDAMALIPLFSNVYVNDRDVESLNNMFYNNKIQRISVTQNGEETDSLWKYSDNDFSCFVEIEPVSYVAYVLGYDGHTSKSIYESLSDEGKDYLSKYANDNSTIVDDLSLDEISSLLYNKDIDMWYNELVKGIADISLYNSYDINNVSIVDTRNEIEGSTHNNYLKMNIVERDGKKYGYYLIDITLDNTDNSFNVESYSQYLFNMINGKKISEKTLKDMFMYIYPFMKVNPFQTFVNNVPSIILPKEFNIAINYMSYVEDNGNSDNSWKYRCFFTDDELEDTTFDKSIYSAHLMNDRKRNIKMLRYFGNIEPIITKRNLLDNVFGIKYKDFNKELGEDNIYEETINIYDYSPIRVTKYNEAENLYYIDKIDQYEYKHFNDNLVYNLDTKIVIDYGKLVKYDELMNLESEEKTYEIFKKYMSNYGSGSMEKSQILFLLNKYKISYESNSEGLSFAKTDKMYSLKYVFDLI